MAMPPLPDLTQLAAWCREVGEVEQVQPWTVEKDFHLTRALWALAEQ